MNIRQGSRAGGLGAIRERPWLFVVLAAVFFAGALFTARALIGASLTEARIRIEIIALDRKAENVSSLIKPIRFDADGLKSALLGEDGLGTGEAGNDRPDPDWRDRLTTSKGGEDGEFIIQLGGANPFQVNGGLSGQLKAFVDRQNRHRAKQRTEAEFWIEQRRAAWQARIDEAKAAIVQSPFDPALPRPSGRSESMKLLRLMIDAMAEAKTAQQFSDHERQGDDLAADTTRLADVSRKIEAGRAAQLHYGTLLREAEAGLARLDEDARELRREDGVLRRPAAVITSMPASGQVSKPLQHLRTAGWQIILPALAIASLILALIVTLIVCKLWPPLEVARDDYLNDPHWPLPQNAHRDLSI